MRSMFSVVSVLFVGLIGCRAGEDQIASRPALASNTPGDQLQICPDICGAGTLCEMPDGSCEPVCNACYCTREGGTAVDRCPEDNSAVRAFQSAASQVVAIGDTDRAR